MGSGARSTSKKGGKSGTLGTRDLYLKSNYQDFPRYQEVDLAIAGDGEASLPALTEAVKRLIDDARKSAFQARAKKLTGQQLATLERTRAHATPSRHESP